MGRSETFGFRDGEQAQIAWWVTETFLVKLYEREGDYTGTYFWSAKLVREEGAPFYSVDETMTRHGMFGEAAFTTTSGR